MKILLSILLSFFILLSGLNFSVATHFCQQSFAAAKISLSGEVASCGMENDETGIIEKTVVSNHCCDDAVSVYSIDKDYTPSFLSFKELNTQLLHVYTLLESDLPQLIYSVKYFTADVSPPDLETSSVELANICIFRI